MAMCAAFGDTPHENLEILIGQLVSLVRDGVPVRMSKRAGNLVTLDEALAFGTLYAEAQRRYLESVSPYARRGQVPANWKSR